MIRGILLFILIAFVLCLFLFMFFNRHRFAFKSTYGVSPPRRVNREVQEMVDKEITGLREALASYESKDIFSLSEIDRDCLGGIKYRISQAIMLAEKYGFQVPPTCL